MKILKGIVVAENERGRVTRDITTRVHSNEMQCSVHVGSSTMKPFVLASNLPDLTSSVSPSLMFHRLSVYGALIHRTAPDDAFGGSDGVKRGPLRCHVPVPELLIKQLNRVTLRVKQCQEQKRKKESQGKREEDINLLLFSLVHETPFPSFA
ncbi:hypothetical protein OIU85_008149 [Salix viminalis]|uniref:Uncharacterized protein n=1 Tax=Salix viminalis TaxID=40686 RepID=A0A9Q0NX59_SALVM|nr:hypothetical protein OIU85_008149 [Salix viminalis]